jgi:AbiV family abortive infection protein
MQTKPFDPPRQKDITVSIEACLANGERLMDDALQLEFQEEGGTRLAISMLAQEEYAKAFMLYMVREGLVPWDSDLLRVMRNHACKHLLAIVMEYVSPEWETIDELRGILNAEYDLEGRFPPHVSSALNILYWEKIRRGEFSDENDYDPSVLAIAFGERDKVKQDALYVDLDKSCRVKSTPVKRITREMAHKEYERAGRYRSTVTSLCKPDADEGIQLQKLREATKAVFWQKYRPIESAEEEPSSW